MPDRCYTELGRDHEAGVGLERKTQWAKLTIQEEKVQLARDQEPGSPDSKRRWKHGSPPQGSTETRPTQPRRELGLPRVSTALFKSWEVFPKRPKLGWQFNVRSESMKESAECRLIVFKSAVGFPRDQSNQLFSLSLKLKIQNKQLCKQNSSNA